jgi:hypothetical protein
MTAIHDALNKAGAPLLAGRLRDRALRFLRNWKLKDKPVSADQADRFLRAILSEPDLALELLDAGYAHRVALEYLEGVRNELPSGPFPRATQMTTAARQPDGEASSSPTSRDGAGPCSSGTPSAVARAVREPSAAAHAAVRAVAHASAVTILDTIMVRDRAIRHIRYGELRRLIGENRFETALLTLVKEHIETFHPNVDTLAEIGDLVSLPEMQRMHQKAAEAASE